MRFLGYTILLALGFLIFDFAGPNHVLSQYGIYPAWKEGVHGVSSSSYMTPQSFGQTQVSRRVNEHMILTNKEIELKQIQQQYQAEFQTPKVGDQIFYPKLEKPDIGVEHSSDVNSEASIRDLQRKVQTPDPIISPDSLIREQIYENDKQATADENFKKEYARQFIENARRGGYEVRLSDDFVVESVTPIKKGEFEKTRLFEE